MTAERELRIRDVVETGLWFRCGACGDDKDFAGHVRGRVVDLSADCVTIQVGWFRPNKQGARWEQTDGRALPEVRDGKLVVRAHNCRLIDLFYSRPHILVTATEWAVGTTTESGVDGVRLSVYRNRRKENPGPDELCYETEYAIRDMPFPDQEAADDYALTSGYLKIYQKR